MAVPGPSLSAASPWPVRDGEVAGLFGQRLPVHGDVVVAVGDEVGVLLRPEALAVAADGTRGGEPVTVRVAAFLGATARPLLATDSGVTLKALFSRESSGPTPGAQCTIAPHDNPVLVAERTVGQRRAAS